MNRRAFLRGAAAGIGALGLAGLSAADAKPITPKQVSKWDYTADVVIVGFGAAGGTATIAAHDSGAKVLVLEKMPAAGGNSAVCHGGMVFPDTVPAGIDYYRKLSFGTVDEDMLEGFSEAMVGVPRLLRNLGATSVKIGEFAPEFPRLRNHSLPAVRFNPTGKEGFQFLSGLVTLRGIGVMLKTTARSLVQAPETGEVVGVKAESEGRQVYIKAERGVILTCGGYENNAELFGYYNYPGLKDFLFPLGTPANTGDGLKMAAAAGAGLWHTAALQWGAFCAKGPSRQMGVAVGIILPRRTKAESFLFVNKYGHRFMRETKPLAHTKETLEVLYFDHERAEYPHVPAYMIFDEAYRQGGPVERDAWGSMGYAKIHGLYQWSSDNLAEIKNGWIARADTVRDLAGKMNIDPGGLEESIKEYNGFCAAGKDLKFNRTKGAMVPIGKPPYYALELGLALVNTQGGPKHNRYGQVLDPDDKPIPRLYAAGELGSFFGFLYQRGSNYAEAFAFGYIAGKRAASEKPFSG